MTGIRSVYNWLATSHICLVDMYVIVPHLVAVVIGALAFKTYLI